MYTHTNTSIYIYIYIHILADSHGALRIDSRNQLRKSSTRWSAYSCMPQRSPYLGRRDAVHGARWGL